MKILINFIALTVLSVWTIVGCQHDNGGGGQSASPPAPNQPVPPQGNVSRAPVTPLPSPTANVADPSAVRAVIQPYDDVTNLFANYLSEQSPEQVPVIGGQLVDELLVQHSLIGPKMWEVENSVLSLDRKGLYSEESANRVALLHAYMRTELRDDARASMIGHGIVLVGTAAAIGGLAGTPAYRSLPSLFPASGRLVARIYRSSREELAATYARGVSSSRDFLARQRQRVAWLAHKVGSGEVISDARQSASAAVDAAKAGGRSAVDSAKSAVDSAKTGIRNAPGRAVAGARSVKDSAVEGTRKVGARIRDTSANVRDAAVDLKDKMTLPIEEITRRNLVAFELPPDQMNALSKLEPVSAADASAFELLPTDMAGMRYVAVGQWRGTDLGIYRRILIGTRRLSLGRASPFKYVISSEMPADLAGAIAARIKESPASSEASRLGRFAYFWDSIDRTFTPMGASLNQIMKHLGDTQKQLLPLFDSLTSKVNWPVALGTAGVSAAAGGIWYYTAYEAGFDNGETYANLDFERLLPNHVQAQPQPANEPEIRPPRPTDLTRGAPTGVPVGVP